ncbi:uncharacterized protein [Acropora muricata]|uniref:uncharacterized protein n=1 Tax=Acropora muricata TaxID=159855 RepID=UPI0034E519F8
MPPKRSARLSASASKPPAAKKQKRGRKSSATVSREEVATPSTANVTLPAIPPDLVEQIVNRVADEVSRRMASGTGGLPSNTNALKEVPVIDMTAAGSAANGISPLVQGSINAVQKNLTGYGKLGARLDSRLPITLPILHRILEAASSFSSSKYQICQFQAMCSIAFLRVGEMTSTTGLGPRPLQIHQVVQLVNDSNTIVALKIVFEDFKHSYNQPPSSMVINRVPIFCPVQLMLDYLALRGNKPGPLFITLHGHPVSRANFTDQLSLAIKFCGLNPARYKGHSFRIGAASHAADRGLSDAQIRVLGRSKSNAFHRYIRIPSVST